MSECNAVAQHPKASEEEVKAVSIRLEEMYHSLVAMHQMCDDAISGSTLNSGTLFVVFRDLLRSAARDAENCSEILVNKRGGLGYFDDDFGSI